MYRLILDTALDFSYIGILNDEKILFESYEKGSNNHSETLFPILNSALNKLNITLKDFKEVYTGVGPGSYTGVRIATVISKMIAVMNDIKLYKFSSLLALSSSSANDILYPLVDCRRGNCYFAEFRRINNKIIRMSDDRVESISELKNRIDENLFIVSGKPNPFDIISSSDTTLIDDPNTLSPNYIQLVEAERIKMGLK